MNARHGPGQVGVHTLGSWSLHQRRWRQGQADGNRTGSEGTALRDLDHKMWALRPSPSGLPLTGISAAKHRAPREREAPRGARRGGQACPTLGTGRH